MKKKTKYLMTGMTVLFLIICFVIYAFLEKQRKERILSEMTIVFQENGDILEYGASIDSAALVKSTVGTIRKYPSLDTHTLGKQKLIFALSYKGEEKEISHMVEIKDTQKPKITLYEKKIQLAYGEEFDAKHNIKSVLDPVDGSLKKIEHANEEGYWISGSVDEKKPGTYTISVHAQDRNGNQSKTSFVVVVEEAPTYTADIKETPISASTKSPTVSSENPVEPYYVNGILLVNKKHALPRNYGGVDAQAYAALEKLQAGAQQAGYAMPLLSGYRSYEYQESLYNYYVSIDGQELADTYSARPGHSEHQSGLAFDVGELNNNYGYTSAGMWLNEHCADYGFILRYPLGKEAITGYQYEPWHVRYVGIDIAKQIMTSNLTLEEYLHDEN